jgi:hypothetical protein
MAGRCRNQRRRLRRQFCLALEFCHSGQNEMNDTIWRFSAIAKDQAAKIKILRDKDATLTPRERQHIAVRRAAREIPDIGDVGNWPKGRGRQTPTDALIHQQSRGHTATKPWVRKCSAA